MKASQGSKKKVILDGAIVLEAFQRSRVLDLVDALCSRFENKNKKTGGKLNNG